MHKILFYPVGNGDTSQIVLSNGKRILFDFRHLKRTEDGEGPEINLKQRLCDELATDGRTSFDVVAFTHGDKDHIENSTEFFELRHAKKYQGEGRIKIDCLWVPAAMVLETATNSDQSADFVIWRQEARHRLKEGSGIRVFSKPDKLKKWFEDLNDSNVTIETRKHLITDAGDIVPEFSLGTDGVEFFCHSPFIKHVDEGEDLRNEAALVFNVRFKVGSATFDYLAVGDSKWEVMEDIVAVTKANKNQSRLSWDIYNIPHHCSYRALSDTKGERETEPKPLIAELLRMGKSGAYLISSSNEIGSTQAAEEQEQPPHIQAKRCYDRYLKEVNGCRLIVTMQYPSASAPKPVTLNIDQSGVSLSSTSAIGAPHVISNPTPRAG